MTPILRLLTFFGAMGVLGTPGLIAYRRQPTARHAHRWRDGAAMPPREQMRLELAADWDQLETDATVAPVTPP